MAMAVHVQRRRRVRAPESWIEDLMMPKHSPTETVAAVAHCDDVLVLVLMILVRSSKRELHCVMLRWRDVQKRLLLQLLRLVMWRHRLKLELCGRRIGCEWCGEAARWLCKSHKLRRRWKKHRLRSGLLKLQRKHARVLRVHLDKSRKHRLTRQKERKKIDAKRVGDDGQRSVTLPEEKNRKKRNPGELMIRELPAVPISTHLLSLSLYFHT